MEIQNDQSRKYEMNPVKQKKRFNGTGETTKRSHKIFVFSPPKADIFVIKILFITKMVI
jgi:hypothetical protein